MIDVDFTYETLQYKSPIPVRGKILAENLFLNVRVLEKDYKLSTLPGLHQTTLPEMAFKIKTFFKTYCLSFDQIDFGRKFFNLVPVNNDAFLKGVSKETLFNLESILFGMIHSVRPELFNDQEVLLNQLYHSGEDYSDTRCLKIKFSPGNFKKVTALMRELHKINPALKFRLDGNRQFELNDLITWEKELPPEALLSIDYIEEPFKNFADTFLFEKRSSLTIALDEAFGNFIADYAFLNPAVIKPSLFGISTVFFWLKIHKETRAIISSSFEHPSVLGGLYFLAKERPLEFHGLENFHQ